MDAMEKHAEQRKFEPFYPVNQVSFLFYKNEITIVCEFFLRVVIVHVADNLLI